MSGNSFLPSISSVTAGAAKVLSGAKQVVTAERVTAVQLPPVPTGDNAPAITVVTVRAVEISSTTTAVTNEEGYLSKLGTLAKSSAASILNSRKESCSHCGKEDSSLSLVTSFASNLERCRVCGAKLCRFVGWHQLVVVALWLVNDWWEWSVYIPPLSAFTSPSPFRPTHLHPTRF